MVQGTCSRPAKPMQSARSSATVFSLPSRGGRPAPLQVFPERQVAALAKEHVLHGLIQTTGLGVSSRLTGNGAVKPIYMGGYWARLEALLPETRRQEETVGCLTQQQAAASNYR